MTPPTVLAHAGGLVGIDIGTTGSPLYDVPAEHALALGLLLALPVVAAGASAMAPGVPAVARLRDGYRARPPLHRFAAWLMGASAVIHLGLFGHHEGLLGVLVVLDGLLLATVAWLLLTGRRWRAAAALVLAGSIGAWWLVTLSGEVPDQVGMLTKLIEIAALAIVLTPTGGARVRGWLGSALVVALVVVTDAAAWAGAFAGADTGHHAGSVPHPGTLLPGGVERAPTPLEVVTEALLYAQVATALEPLRDLHTARAAGYQVDDLVGLGAHAPNPAYVDDGLILDPARPENLVYAVGPAGPVLLGAMFEMPDGAGPGPAFGGRLTVWHGHEHVCIGLLPPGLTGLVSPLGGCPVGSAGIARTPEMIHVWVVPGTPVRWGDLDEAWIAAYVAGGAGGAAPCDERCESAT